MRPSIVAVTVTYNDIDYLKTALEAIRAQTVPVSKIIVVDNSSIPENRALLEKEVDEGLEVLWLEENKGGAGGFESGMKYAHEKYAPDWYWLMDADAKPYPDCLEKLLKYGDDKNIGILAPVIYGADLQQYQLYHIKNVSKFLYRDIPLYDNFEQVPSGTSRMETYAFVGALVSRCAVDKLGYVDGQLFIYGDDHEYTYRVSRQFDELLVKEAVINHRDQPVNGRQKPENWWKDYYAFRNRVLFIRKYSKNRMDEIIGITMLRLRLFKQLLINEVAPYNRKMKGFRRKLLCQAVRDGISGEIGKTVDPGIVREKIADIEQETQK